MIMQLLTICNKLQKSKVLFILFFVIPLYKPQNKCRVYTIIILATCMVQEIHNRTFNLNET